MNKLMKELCVVHLVRAHNGIEPFRRFLESYRNNHSGIEHDLLIIFKGFEFQKDIEKYQALLPPIQYLTLEVSDDGFDITAYFTAIRCYSEKYRFFCFLNSYSEILEQDWLRKLHESVSKPGVGLVGATGSWNSNSTNAYIWFRCRAETIQDLLLKRKQKKIITNTGTKKVLIKESSCLRKIIPTIKGALAQFPLIIYFDPFPNYHIRTNAFMISGKLMKTLECPAMKTKMDAYRFESGSKGITKQILNMEKKVCVVGKDGMSYKKEEWDKSNTFWKSEQENLLVADNQTRDYQYGSPQRRRKLFSMAWKKASFKDDNA
ncbi:MAG: hypothetical protein L3J69_00355 [Desulfobacula sp.]|nr:hypothetical protein [Desulfobacula sp.]